MVGTGFPALNIIRVGYVKYFKPAFVKYIPPTVNIDKTTYLQTGADGFVTDPK